MQMVTRPYHWLLCALFLVGLLPVKVEGQTWEPTKPIEFVIPAGTGGGADQMARLIAGITEKNKLSPRPIIAVNKSGGAGAEGFLYVKEKKRGRTHDYHHALQSLHDSASYRRSL